MKTFAELHAQQTEKRIMELLDVNNYAELERIRGRAFETELIEAARHEPIPLGSLVLYATVRKQHYAGFTDWHTLCLTRASAIAAHCELQQVQEVWIRDVNERYEIHISSTPLGCSQLRYRLGLFRSALETFCRNHFVKCTDAFPYIERLPESGRMNPANTFPNTPDCEDVIQKMFRCAN